MVITDQSSFSASQSVLQAPPMPEVVPPQDGKKRAKWWLIGGAVGLFLMTLLIISRPRTNTGNKVVSSPSPTPIVRSQTSMDKELQSADEIVSRTKLEESLISPPQVQMNIEF